MGCEVMFQVKSVGPGGSRAIIQAEGDGGDVLDDGEVSDSRSIVVRGAVDGTVAHPPLPFLVVLVLESHGEIVFRFPMEIGHDVPEKDRLGGGVTPKVKVEICFGPFDALPVKGEQEPGMGAQGQSHPPTGRVVELP